MKAETCKILTNGKGIIHEQSSKETADVDCNAKKNPVGKKRLPPFTYPPLPEIKICYAITIATMAYAWYCVFIASQKWIALVDKSVLPMSKLPFFGHRFKDESNWEWFRWSPFAMQYLPSMLLHSLVFNTFDRFLPENIWIPLYILISMMISAYLFTFKLLACSLVQGLFIFACTFQFRKTSVVWLSSIPLLYVIMNETALLASDPFLILVFVPYTLLSFISFNLELANNNIPREHSGSVYSLLQRMLFYTFYQPYLFSLIVVYPNFERQLNERSGKQFDGRRVLFNVARMIFWWALIELMLHFFYFSVIMFDDKFAAQLPKNEFVSVGMAMGAFFHMKYVIIFGLPSMIAIIDRMEPPERPICIQRVSLYSKIWRGFDRGLYDFFKTYIFVPICWPTFSLSRKLFGVAVSFTFVLLWHGFQHHNVVWITLNIAELFIEFGAKALYVLPLIRKTREQLVSDVNFRRILGLLQILPFAFGLYSNFYFLGGSKIGWLFVQRIFLEETITVRWPFLLLIFLGYFYMQVAMEVDMKINYANRCPVKCPVAMNGTVQNGKKKD